MLSYSTLPVKGEESLETSTRRDERPNRQLNTASSPWHCATWRADHHSLTNRSSQAMVRASNLDNRISTPLAEQPLGIDKQHGSLTARCGRDSGATRSIAHGNHDTASCGLTFDWVSVVLAHTECVSHYITQCVPSLVVPPIVSSACSCLSRTQLQPWPSKTAAPTTTRTYLVVPSSTCLHNPTCRLGSGLTRTALMQSVPTLCLFRVSD